MASDFFLIFIRLSSGSLCVCVCFFCFVFVWLIVLLKSANTYTKRASWTHTICQNYFWYVHLCIFITFPSYLYFVLYNGKLKTESFGLAFDCQLNLHMNYFKCSNLLPVFIPHHELISIINCHVKWAINCAQTFFSNITVVSAKNNAKLEK